MNKNVLSLIRDFFKWLVTRSRDFYLGFLCGEASVLAVEAVLIYYFYFKA
jgi:hypothetical protein